MFHLYNADMDKRARPDMSEIEAWPTCAVRGGPTAPPNGRRHNYVLLTGTSRCTTIGCSLGFIAQRLTEED